MIKQFILAHQTAIAVLAFMLFSNAVLAMPSPDDKSGKFYRWSFNLLHSVGAGLPRLFPLLRFGAAPDSK